ncbi:MAG: hypothetical protein KY455_01295 [Euryarchaeota archaeon]|nr:hypothetical protein [Euryarchaeota archaeon]
MSRVRPLLAVLVLALVALSGCVGEEDAPMDEVKAQADKCVATDVCGAKAVLDETGRDLRTDLTAEDELPAPTWEVGDVFEQHIYYGNADQNGEHIVTMVVDDGGDCYTVATTSQNAAKFEVVFDLPILGCIEKEHLQTSAFDTDWDWMYDFPLTDGKTWDGKLDFLFNWNDNGILNYEFTLTAAYASKIDTEKGDFPGFVITGVTAEGEELLRYNYVPAVGWFSHFWIYDLTTDVSEDVIFHAMSMGRSSGYVGPYYVDESVGGVEAELFPTGFIFQAAFQQNVVTPTPPVRQFTVPEDATYLKGVIVPVACGGQSHVSLIDPANKKTDYSHAHDDPAYCRDAGGFDPALYTINFYDEPAVPGEWKITVAPAAFFGGVVAVLTAIKEVQYELTAKDLPTQESETGTE